jgi:hypothetical protein
MAPSFALNANPQGMVGAVGRSIPLAFLLSTVGVLLIALVSRRAATDDLEKTGTAMIAPNRNDARVAGR